MRRQQLTETQIAALFDPPTEPRELIRHYTLTETDLVMVRRCRGDHSRLGYALMLCYLRYPGRPLPECCRPRSLPDARRRDPGHNDDLRFVFPRVASISGNPENIRTQVQKMVEMLNARLDPPAQLDLFAPKPPEQEKRRQ